MGKKKSTQTQEQRVNVPAWLDSRNQQLIDRAFKLSEQPYVEYGGERLAGFTPDQLRAFELVRGAEGSMTRNAALANRGVEDLFRRAQGPSSSDIESLMNPYLDQVLSNTKRREIENQQEGMARLKQESALAGAFGGSRFALEKQLQEDRDKMRLSDIDYQGRFDAFNNAQNQFNVGTNVLSEGIGRAMEMGSNDPSIRYAQSLLGIGNQQQIQDQTGLDLDYEEFIRQQAYPYEQAQYAQSFLQPYTDLYRGQTTTTTSRQSGGGLQKAIGAGMAIAGVATGNPMMAMQGLGAATGAGGGGMPMGDMGGFVGSNKPFFGIFGTPGQQSYNRTMQRGFANPGLYGPGFADGGEVEGYLTGGSVDMFGVMDGEKRPENFLDNAPITKGINDLSAYLRNTPLIAYDGEGAISDLSRYILDKPKGTDAAVIVQDAIADRQEVPAVASPMPPSLPNLPFDEELSVGDVTPQSLEAMFEKRGTAGTGVPVTVDRTGGVSVEGLPQTPVTEEYIRRLVAQADAPVEDSRYMDYEVFGLKGTMNVPLFKAGLAMMSSDGDFFDALAAGGNAFATQLEASRKDKTTKAAESLDRYGEASKAERDAMQTLSNRMRVIKMNADANNPYKVTKELLDLRKRKLQNQLAEKRLSEPAEGTVDLTPLR